MNINDLEAASPEVKLFILNTYGHYQRAFNPEGFS